MARPKGVPNNLTKGARHAIFEVFESIGGACGLADWAKENRNEFYKLWGKTIPQHTQLTGMDGGAIETKGELSELDKVMLQQYVKSMETK